MNYFSDLFNLFEGASLQILPSLQTKPKHIPGEMVKEHHFCLFHDKSSKHLQHQEKINEMLFYYTLLTFYILFSTMLTAYQPYQRLLKTCYKSLQ